MRRREIRLDPQELLNIIGVGLRRASAFVRLGLDGLESRGNGDFNLSAGMQYQFWNDRISDEERENTKNVYRAWLVGSCLREIDMFYGMFLDSIWECLQLVDLHGRVIEKDLDFDRRFPGRGVAERQVLVADRLGAVSHYESLNSLNLARNSLTHNAGIVRAPRDCNGSTREVLRISWLALEPVAMRGGATAAIEKYPFDGSELPGKGGFGFGIRPAERAVTVAAGAPIELTREQLAELCLFHHILASQLVQAFGRHLESRGIAPSGVPAVQEEVPLTGALMVPESEQQGGSS